MRTYGAAVARSWWNTAAATGVAVAVANGVTGIDVPRGVWIALLIGGIVLAQVSAYRSLSTTSEGAPGTVELAGEVALPVAPVRARRPVAAPAWLERTNLSGLRAPTGIAVAADRVYVADHVLGCVVALDGSRTDARLSDLDRPHHLSVTPTGLLIADSHHDRVVFTDHRLAVVWARDRFGHHRLARPHAAMWQGGDTVYVLSSDNNRLLRVDGGTVAGVRRNRGDRGGSGVDEFDIPCGLGTGPDLLVVADTYNHRIKVLTLDLHTILSFGTYGEGDGQFAYPVGVAYWRGWIVVSDEHNQRLQVWHLQRKNGAVEPRCCSSDLCSRWLGSPFGVTFDIHGRLYVTDRERPAYLAIDFPRLAAAAFSSA